MSTLEDQVAEEQAAYEAETGPNVKPRRQNVETEEPETTVDNEDNEAEEKPAGQDAEMGKLFDVPRVQVILDDTDPSVLKVAFSGQVELERGKADEVAFYNRLVGGKGADLHVHAHVAGQKKSHRRDSEGNVDAVVEVKSLIITDVSLV